MVNLVTEQERERLLQIAQEYRQKGYNVVFQPQGEDLPAFLEGYQPNIIAQRDDDKVLIVVLPRADSMSAHNVAYFAEKVDKQSDWRLEVVVSNPSDSVDYAPTEGSLAEAEIQSRLSVARELANQDLESALLYTWSLTEAMLRLLAKTEELSLSRFDPSYLLKLLAVEGVISKAEYELLKQVLQVRNLVAHGFKTNSLTQLSVAQLIDTTEQLLSSLHHDT